jgi:MSHA biogenesis protein MshP
MTRSSFILPSRRRCAGVGLVTALFLLVVLAGLAVAMVTLFNSQQQAASLDEQGSRAYQAARAGIEWGLFQQLRAGSCADSATFALPSDSVLSGFVVTVTCKASGTDPLTRHVFEATACNLPGSDGKCPNTATNSSDYVQRKVEAEI